jgi:outer membrane receptor protein involved in Fe transport
VRLQTLTDFGGSGKLRLMAANYSEDEAGPSMPLLVDPVMIPGLLFGVSPSTDPRTQKTQAAQFKVDVNQLLANWKQDIGDNALDITASWRKSKVHHAFDGDGTEASVASVGVDTRGNDRSIDIHLASPDDAKLQWLVGATLLRFDQRQDVDVSAQVPYAFLLPPSPPPPPSAYGIPVPLQILLGGNVVTRSEALYSDVRYQLTPSWALLGGLRLSRDHKSADEYQKIAAFGVDGTGKLDAAWTSVPWKIGAEYRIGPDSIAYGKVSHGFKSGAVNLGSLQTAMVRPENVISSELGYKTDFAQRRGLFTAALFSAHYKDMQVSQVGIGNVILVNASKATINGAEFELSYKPVAPLTVNASLGLMDPKYTSFTNADVRNPAAGFQDVSGHQLAFVSKTQAFLGAEYALPIAGYKATARIDYAYRGKVYFTEFNTADAMQNAYGIFNVAFSVKPSEGHWKVFGYVKNVTNKVAIDALSISSPVLGSARQVTYIPPRMFGVGVQLDF